MAETLTSKLKLAKHDTGDLNWGADANANMDALDQFVQQAVLRPPRTLLATLGSGAAGANLLGGATYFYKVTAVNAVGETTEGQIPAVVEAQVTQPATPLPVILQWETVAGATGYKIYKSTASGQEQFLAQVAGQATSTYTDTGGTATTAAAVPISNTARTSVSQILAGANVTVSPPDGTGAVTVSAAGSGPSGYATVVVAAPSGSAATDTANVQNAINAVSSKGGGSVILREGTYLINATITLASNVALLGQGRNATALQASGLGAVSMLLANSGQSHVQIKHLTIDMNFPVRGAQSIPSGGADVQVGPNVGFFNILEDVLFKNGTSVNEHILWDSGSIINCELYFNGSAANNMVVTSAGQISDCYLNISVLPASFSTGIILCQGEGCIFGNVIETAVGGTNVVPVTIYLSTPGVVSGNTFRSVSGQTTTHISVNGNGAAAVVGNAGGGGGDIEVTNAATIVAGNSSFKAYVGGTQSGNNGQTSVNNGSVAGGDLGGTYPNPTVAKVNGTSVPAAPSAGQVLTATGPTAAAWQTPAAGSTPGYPSIYGTGKDGSVTYSANATLAATDSYGVSAENSGFNVAEINCTDLTINAGVTVTLAARVHGGDPLGVNGLVIRSQGPVTINGILDVSGKGAQVDTGSVNPNPINGLGLLYDGVPSPLVFPALFSQGGPTGGGNPGTSFIAPGGGGGGNSGAYQGGSGGQAIRAATLALLQKLPLRHWGVIFLCGSSGGTGGGGGNNVGGNGGGFVLIFAPSITIGSTGQILANGTIGNPNGSSVNDGGGGGGGGGLILLAYGSLSNAGALSANGGAGGPGAGGSFFPGGAGGVNTTLNGQPTSGASGASGSPNGGGGGGAGGVILGIQVS